MRSDNELHCLRIICVTLNKVMLINIINIADVESIK